MNIDSKVELLYSAIQKILKDDNIDTGSDVREIQFYVEDRILRKNLRQNLSNPKILMDITEQLSESNLPTSSYMLELMVVVDETQSYSLTVLDRIIARIEYLLNRKHNSLNAAMSTKYLRCRKILKTSAITTYDGLMKIHIKNIMFDIQADDEILQC